MLFAENYYYLTSEEPGKMKYVHQSCQAAGTLKKHWPIVTDRQPSISICIYDST